MPIWVWGLFVLAAYGAGLWAGTMDERWKHRIMHKYTARTQGYIMTRSCCTAIGQLTAAVGAVDGRIDPADVDGPFSFRQQSGAMSYAAVAVFQAPAGFKAPAGWRLYRSHGQRVGGGYDLA